MLLSPSANISQKYRCLSTSIRAKTRASYKEYLHTLHTKRYSNPKTFWSIVKSKHNAAPPSAFILDKSTFSTPTEICDGFGHFFNRSFGISPLPFRAVSCFTPDTIPPPLTSASEVARLIKALPNGTAPGPDKIPIDILKLAPEAIARPLAMLFNLSFARSEIPVQWKEASVIPLYKRTGSRNDIKNYRPISLLSSVSKIMEKIIFDRMNSFATGAKIIPASQFGFRRGHSCTTLGVQAFHDWSKNLDFRVAVDTHVIFLDWSRAFDSVQHSLLMDKLIKLGFHASYTNWIFNYFRERSQQVCFNGSSSIKFPLLIGVPQGALLSSLFFNLFTSDLPSVITNSTIKSYADDSFIYSAIRSSVDSFNLQSDLSAIQSWGVLNGLQLNHAKSVFMVISRRATGRSPIYHLNGQHLLRVYSHKSLGVIYQSNLKWSLHVDYVCAKARRINALIGRTVGNAPIALDFYRAYSLPLLEFSSPIWQLNLQKDIDKIESVQRRFTRLFLGLKATRRHDSEPSYSDRLRLLKLHSLHSRRRSASLTLIFKFIHGINPINLIALLSFNSFKAGKVFTIPFARCDAFFNSFFLSAAKHWNSLSAAIREIDSLGVFKKAILDF